MSILFVMLALAALALWCGVGAGSTSLHGSDAAGNAMSQGFVALGAIVLWVLLIALLLIAGNYGRMVGWAPIAAFFLMPTSGFGVQMALHVMSRDEKLKWPMVLPIAIPGLLLGYAAWTYFWPVGSGGLATGFSAVVWGVVAILTPLPWIVRWREIRADLSLARRTPEELAKAKAEADEERLREKRERFDRMNADSPFREWWDFVGDEEFGERAFTRARAAKDRQVEVEQKVGNASMKLFLALPQLDLELTPELSKGIAEFLDDQVKHLRPYDPAQPMATSVVTEWFEQYFATLRWGLGKGGNWDGELAAIEAAVCKYPDCPERQKFVRELKTLRKIRIYS